MANDYPITFDTTRPRRFQRAQVFLRILIAIVMSLVISYLGTFGVIYLALPVASAIFLSQRNGERFLAEDGKRIGQWLRWILAFYAYLAFLTDRLPTEKPQDWVRLDIIRGGSPSVGSALLRLVTSIPSALALALLSIVSGFIWIIAAVWVLASESYPQPLYNFQRGVLRWQARLLGYHASLVDRYPPFAIDTTPIS